MLEVQTKTVAFSMNFLSHRFAAGGTNKTLFCTKKELLSKSTTTLELPTLNSCFVKASLSYAGGTNTIAF